MFKQLQTRMRFSKAVIWMFAFFPLSRLFWLALNDDLGANPIEFIEHSTGIWGLVFLMMTLSITPLSILLKQGWIATLRRLLGLWMFTYATLHLTTYLWLDYSFDWQEIYKDIIKHPYVIVGALAYLVTLTLATTSNRYAISRLRQRWKPLHRSVYLIAVLALLHFWWLVKKDITEPMIYMFVFVMLMLPRVTKVRNYLKSFSV